MKQINRVMFADSEIVSFNRIGVEGNYTYCVNGSRDRRFPFEELCGIYFKPGSRAVFCCSLNTNEGQSLQLFRLGEEEFWNCVDGKQFKVITDYSTRKLQHGNEDGCLKERIDLVLSLLDSGSDDKLDSILSPVPCYQFIALPE